MKSMLFRNKTNKEGYKDQWKNIHPCMTGGGLWRFSQGYINILIFIQGGCVVQRFIFLNYSRTGGDKVLTKKFEKLGHQFFTKKLV